MTKHLSGRFVLRLTAKLHALAKQRAVQLDISLNDLCRRAIENYLTQAQSNTGGARHVEAELVHRAQELVGESFIGLVLFGSMARGEARDSSDVDLLIVVKRELALERRLYVQWDTAFADSRLSPHFVHLPLNAEQAGSIWLEVAIDGILLFENGRDISHMLGKIRTAMAAGRIVRKTAYGHPYWIKAVGE